MYVSLYEIVIILIASLIIEDFFFNLRFQLFFKLFRQHAQASIFVYELEAFVQ